VVTSDIFTRLTAAVAPLSAYVMLAAGLGLLKRVIANQPKEEKPKRASGKRRVEKPSDSVPPTHVEPEVTIVAEDLAGPKISGLPNPMWPETYTAGPDDTGTLPRLGKDGHPVNQS
jgi:hypothetical protein